MLILISLFISIVLWADLSSKIVWLIFSITILFGLIGAFDDYKKLKNNSSDGFKGSHRLIVEFLICFLFVFFNKIINPDLVNIVFIPFYKRLLF